MLGGTLPIDSSIEMGIHYKLITREQGYFNLDHYTVNEILPFCNTVEINKEAYRSILKKIIISENFEWLVFYQKNPEEFKIYIPDNWNQLLSDAELLNFEDTTVIEWWEYVFKHFRKYKERQLTQLGTTAEKLSYSYEYSRLENDNLTPIDFYLKWIASMSDKYGYDIASVRGELLKDIFAISDSIQVEVKGQLAADESNFIFYVTQNEWNVALRNINSYFFHCWVGVDVNKSSGQGPYIIPAIRLSSMLPTNVSPECEWVKCRFMINLNTYIT